jgi:quercetin dioxygenase-like cupin family protein
MTSQIKLYAAALAGVAMLSATGAAAQAPSATSSNGAQQMEITRNGSQPSTKGPAEWFTGNVRIDASFQRQAPARVGGGMVTFEPGARTAWHKHPLGQTLIVTSGSGWTQVEGGPVQQFYAGDVLWCPPEVKHWHGATATTAMTHINIQESLNGSPVTWFAHVTDAEYLAGARGN